MAGGTAVILEDVVTLDLLGSHCLLVALEILVERAVRCEECLLILGNGIGDGSLAESLRIYCSEESCELLVLCDAG